MPLSGLDLLLPSSTSAEDNRSEQAATVEGAEALEAMKAAEARRVSHRGDSSGREPHFDHSKDIRNRLEAVVLQLLPPAMQKNVFQFVSSGLSRINQSFERPFH